MQMQDVVIIGDNSHYGFGVGRAGARWLGFAIAVRTRSELAFESVGLPVAPLMYFVFPEVSENHELGFPDRSKAIRLVAAIAQDPEHGYGGIDRWYVSKVLRGKPDDFRCEECARVGCDGRECRDAAYDYADVEDMP